MAAHRMNNHPDASAAEWFTDCQTCARLEERHANALSNQMQDASTPKEQHKTA